MYWEPCRKGKIVTTEQVQLGIEIPLLVTVCCDNSGFSGVVTLNSHGGVLPRWFSPLVNKSLVSNLLSATLSIIGDLFVPPRFTCN